MSKKFRQARWDEPTLFELGWTGRLGYKIPEVEDEIKLYVGEVEKVIPEQLKRKKLPELPQLSEPEVVRHFTRLSQMSYGVDLGPYPLGSCTMKYSPKIGEVLAALEEVRAIHPFQDTSAVQGVLEIMYNLSKYLAEIVGMHSVSLQPAAGAQAELTGALIMRAFHKFNNQVEKDEIIIPDSAHGTNPASAAMAGFKVIVIPSADDGCVDIEALKVATSKRTAGLMLTNPNTLGVFERDIDEIAQIIHGAGGLLYYDGANLNSILGKTRPGDMGFDIAHINVHKTFSTPHGGGGPGAGPIGVTKELDKFLPVPTIEFDGEKYYFDYNRPYSIGKVHGFYGNFSVLLKTYIYILAMGAEGLEEVAELSVLNANYLLKKLMKIRGYELPYGPGRSRKHEGVISVKKLYKDTGVSARDVAKRMSDYGVHPPTIYFPSIVSEAMMIEPTETETKEGIDRLVDILEKISTEAYTDRDKIMEAPQNTSTTRIDEIKASHPKTFTPSWKLYKRRMEGVQ